ncbi:MAG: class I SAM-dependent methyltransferase [Methylococcales bacterium]
MLNELLKQDLSNVVKTISDLDDMFQGNEEHYFSVGESALKCINHALLLADKKVSNINSILDFPCGFGRVLRVLNTAFPKASITGCDLVKEGVDFCEKQFGSKAVYSDKNLNNINLSTTYDLIWVGSLLTHVDKNQWKAFLDFFNKSLNPGGILLFTAQGRYSASLLKNNESTYGLESDEKINNLLNSYDLDGFGFSNYYHSDDYGITLSAPSNVIKQIELQSNLQLLMCLERGWDNHQDVYACTKST